MKMHKKGTQIEHRNAGNIKLFELKTCGSNSKSDQTESKNLKEMSYKSV
jgi:hypothetical protein